MDSLHRSGVCTLRCAGVGDPWIFNQESSSAHLQLDLDPYTGSLHNGEEGKGALKLLLSSPGAHPADGPSVCMAEGPAKRQLLLFSMSGNLSASQTGVPTQEVMSKAQEHVTSSMGQIRQGCVGWGWLHGTLCHS